MGKLTLYKVKTDRYLELICSDGLKLYDVKPYRVDLSYRLRHNGELCNIENGISINEHVEQLWKSVPRLYGGKAVEITSVGVYHSRVYRPMPKSNQFLGVRPNDVIGFPYDEKVLIQSLQQLKTLVRQLTTIFDYVYPNSTNFSSYGNELRNLLILSCTEVEAQCRGILAVNQYPDSKPTMKDYFKLNKHLKLDEYAVSLRHFPEVATIRPFNQWNITSFQALDWYQSYNAVKHDRAGSFREANLKNVISSVCAIAVLIRAQYGPHIDHWDDLIGSFFDIEKPDWSFDEFYVPPLDDEEWIEKPLQI